jgi:hypothetical protein
MVGWTNLLQNQSPYLLKKMVKFWKLQCFILVYIDFLDIFSMSLMAHLEYIYFKTFKKRNHKIFLPPM